MADRTVHCALCGRAFDADREGYYDEAGGSWTCPQCMWKDVPPQTRWQFGGWGKAIVKLAVGLIFLVTAFSMEETPSMLVGLVMGLAIIAWGLIPLLRSLLAFRSSQAQRQEAERQRRAAARQRQNAVRTCPNCGASTKGPVCEYCGSPLG